MWRLLTDETRQSSSRNQLTENNTESANIQPDPTKLVSYRAANSDVNKNLTFKAKDQVKVKVNYNQYRVKLEKIMSNRT